MTKEQRIAAENDDKLCRSRFSELEQSAPKLLCCPFCGSPASFGASYSTMESPYCDKILGGVWVRCSDCMAQIGYAGDDHYGSPTGEFDNFLQAAEAWNKRPTQKLHYIPDES